MELVICRLDEHQALLMSNDPSYSIQDFLDSLRRSLVDEEIGVRYSAEMAVLLISMVRKRSSAQQQPLPDTPDSWLKECLSAARVLARAKNYERN